MKKVFSILLALCAISVVLSGCSGGGGEAGATTGDAKATTGTEEAK